MLLAINPMERAKAKLVPRVGTAARMPEEAHSEKRNLWRALLLPPHLSDASRPDPLGWESLPFNSVRGSNQHTHEWILLHTFTSASPSFCNITHQLGEARGSLMGKSKKKKKILFPLVVGAELKLPLRRQLTALTCLLLTSVEKMTTLLVLFQIDQVFNPRGLGALKYLCEGLSQ